ncbi:aminoacyl--tRNA ligase-related protein [Yinghuangia aomiensis]
MPTLRDDPADADAASHRLLVRGGFVRQLMAGHYSLLPLAVRVRAKVVGVIREEMDRIGAQEWLLPAMHPAEVWQKTGRWEAMGEEMFRLKDRKGADLALGMTHEEIVATAALELASYKQLPQTWYQFQTKFRDEPRPKSGLMRVREFTMKDAYSFDLDQAGLDRSFERNHGAYTRIFRRLGIPAIPVQASSGSMGGSTSIEFMSPTEAGRTWSRTARAATRPTSRRRRRWWRRWRTRRLRRCRNPSTHRTPRPSTSWRRATVYRRTGRSRRWSTSSTTASRWC